jgi:hypothetical protein
MKALQVIDQAFRTTTEEQDDTILWLTQSMRGAGGHLTVLLSGHAVYYATQHQTQPALTIAGWAQTQPANLPKTWKSEAWIAKPCSTVYRQSVAKAWSTYMKAWIRSGNGDAS